MSYHYLSSLCYFEIHLLSFICLYFTSIYKKYVILLGFICNNHKILLISQTSNKSPCNIFKGYYSLKTSKSTTPRKLQSPKHRKHRKTEIYRGSDDRGEGDCDFDLNRLDSVILRQYTTLTNQCYKLTWNWRWCIQYCDC